MIFGIVELLVDDTKAVSLYFMNPGRCEHEIQAYYISSQTRAGCRREARHYVAVFMPAILSEVQLKASASISPQQATQTTKLSMQQCPQLRGTQWIGLINPVLTI